MSLLGFGMGLMSANFHMCGIILLLRTVLNMLVRNVGRVSVFELRWCVWCLWCVWDVWCVCGVRGVRRDWNCGRCYVCVSLDPLSI